MNLGLTKEKLLKMRELRAKAQAQKKLIEASLNLLRKEKEHKASAKYLAELKTALESDRISELEQEIKHTQLKLPIEHIEILTPKSDFPSPEWRAEFDAAQKRRIARGEAREEEAVLFGGIDRKIQDIALNRGSLLKERLRIIEQIKWVSTTRAKHEVISEEGITRYANREVRQLRILNDLLKMHGVTPLNVFGKPIKKKM